MTQEQARVVLNNIYRNRHDLERVYEILLGLLRNAGDPAPMSEIITIIKHETPELYGMLKRRSVAQPGMQLLFELHLDYAQAKRRLGIS